MERNTFIENCKDLRKQGFVVNTTQPTPSGIGTVRIDTLIPYFIIVYSNDEVTITQTQYHGNTDINGVEHFHLADTDYKTAWEVLSKRLGLS